MKLRIKGNSIRLRLTRPEVEALGNLGFVEETTNFGVPEDQAFFYRIERTEGAIVTATFAGGGITVGVPHAIANEWAASEQVGFSGRLALDDGKTLDILVEKDFACLKPRDSENESDNFPHPNAGIDC